MEGGKRKVEEQQKKDESLVLKVNQECVSKIVLPFQCRRHCLAGETKAQSWSKSWFL